MTIREIFATNLRRARHKSKLTQEVLAHEAGIDRTYVSALERGLYSVSLDTIERIAGALSIEPHILLIPFISAKEDDRISSG
jgi:transcriptional regulator with XRE-family HTH domain